jgi:hypothetical protein
MANRNFQVEAVWDAEARVWVSESDIIGLHIEAPSLDVFEEVLFDTAAELIVANHLSAPELASTPLKDLLPGIIWKRPPADADAAA